MTHPHRHLVILLCALTIGLLFWVVPVLAQEEAPTDPVTQTLKDRVQKVLEAQDGAIAGSQTTRQTTFGIVGSLDKIVGSTLQITTVSGDSRIAELEKTALVSRQGRSIPHEEIELNSTIVASGTLDQDNSYNITRLSIVSDTILPTRRQTLLGSYTASTNRTLTFGLIGTNEGATTSVPLSSRTQFLNILTDRIEKKTLREGDNILVILPQEQTASASALRVYSLTSVQPTP